jgi:hypothetical protein
MHVMPQKLGWILAIVAVTFATVSLCAVVSPAEPPNLAAASAAGNPVSRNPVPDQKTVPGKPVPGESGSKTASSPFNAGSAGELIGFSGFTGSGSQTITLVHTGKMQMAVYHIDRSGQIHLVSSRPIEADFSLTLNPTAPLPDEIRKLRSDSSR